MKKIILLGMFFLFVMGASNSLHAQTTKCSPAKMAACKKICGEKSVCTAAQKAACKAICKKTASAKTVGIVEAPLNLKPAGACCSKTKTAKMAVAEKVEKVAPKEMKMVANKE